MPATGDEEGGSSDDGETATEEDASTDPIDLGDFFYQGDATSRGIEVLLQKKLGRHTGWLSSALSRSEYSFPGLEENPCPASQDQTHELKLVDTVRLALWLLSGMWIYATGRPYAEPTEVESTVVDERFTFDRLILGERNAQRLPDYHRLDLAAHYELPIGRTQATFGLSVFNVYSRDRVWYREFRALQGELIENDIMLMGRTVNVFAAVKL